MLSCGKADWARDVIDDFYDRFRAKRWKRPKKTWRAKGSRCPTRKQTRSANCAAAKWSSKCGRYGKFLACSGFPGMQKHASAIVKETGGLCPKCGSRVLVRQSKKGRVYYGCENNPDVRLS